MEGTKVKDIDERRGWEVLNIGSVYPWHGHSCPSVARDKDKYLQTVTNIPIGDELVSRRIGIFILKVLQE